MANRVDIGAKGSKLDYDNWGVPVTQVINEHDGRIVALEGQRLLAYGQRITTGTATTTVEQGYLRIDNIPITAGQSYRIWTSPLVFDSTVANDLITVPVRVNTSGVATTASTQVTVLANNAHSASNSQKTNSITVLYIATVTGVLSILISYVRSIGTGNVRIVASSVLPSQLAIEAMGADPGNTGVSL